MAKKIKIPKKLVLKVARKDDTKIKNAMMK